MSASAFSVPFSRQGSAACWRRRAHRRSRLPFPLPCGGWAPARRRYPVEGKRRHVSREVLRLKVARDRTVPRVGGGLGALANSNTEAGATGPSDPICTARQDIFDPVRSYGGARLVQQVRDGCQLHEQHQPRVIRDIPYSISRSVHGMPRLHISRRPRCAPAARRYGGYICPLLVLPVRDRHLHQQRVTHAVGEDGRAAGRQCHDVPGPGDRPDHGGAHALPVVQGRQAVHDLQRGVLDGTVPARSSRGEFARPRRCPCRRPGFRPATRRRAPRRARPGCAPTFFSRRCASSTTSTWRNGTSSSLLPYSRRRCSVRRISTVPMRNALS